MTGKRQFSLGSLLIATAFLAASCAALRLMFGDADRTAKLFGLLMLPILLCGAVGSLRGRLAEWLGFGTLMVIGIIPILFVVGAITWRLK